MRSENIDRYRGELDPPPSLLGFRRDKLPTLAATLAGAMLLDLEVRSIEIHGASLKTEELSQAHPVGKRQHIDGLQSMAPDRLLEGLRLSLVKAVDFGILDLGLLRKLNDIPDHEQISFGVPNRL